MNLLNRPLILEIVLVALGVATILAVALWRVARDRQRKLQALDQVIEQLRAENQRLASTESSVIHDLMQPLGTITNYAEMIRMHSTENVSGYASRIIEVSAKAARRIRERGTTTGNGGQQVEPVAEFISGPVEVVETPRAQTAPVESWSSTPVGAASDRLP